VAGALSIATHLAFGGADRSRLESASIAAGRWTFERYCRNDPRPVGRKAGLGVPESPASVEAVGSGDPEAIKEMLETVAKFVKE
jgi:hypothetical protein